MNRPLIPIALLYAAGILLGEFFPVSLTALLATTVTLVVTSLFLTQISSSHPHPTYLAHGSHFTYATHITLFAAILLAGWSAMLASTSIISPNDLRTLV